MQQLRSQSLQTRMSFGREFIQSLLETVQPEDSSILGETYSHLR